MNILLEDLMKSSTSLYGLVLASASRANELSSGEQPLINTKSKKISTIALEEISRNKIHFEIPKPK